MPGRIWKIRETCDKLRFYSKSFARNPCDSPQWIILQSKGNFCKLLFILYINCYIAFVIYFWERIGKNNIYKCLKTLLFLQRLI